MELFSRDEAATRLRLSVEQVDEMVATGRLLAVRFAHGVRIVGDWDSVATDSATAPNAAV